MKKINVCNYSERYNNLSSYNIDKIETKYYNVNFDIFLSLEDNLNIDEFYACTIRKEVDDEFYNDLELAKETYQEESSIVKYFIEVSYNEINQYLRFLIEKKGSFVPGLTNFIEPQPVVYKESDPDSGCIEYLLVSDKKYALFILCPP